MRIRDAVPEDADALAAVHVASWKDAYRGMLDDAYLDALMPADRLDAWRERLAADEPGRVILLAEDEAGEVLGFTSLVAHPHLGPPGPSCRSSTWRRRRGAEGSAWR